MYYFFVKPLGHFGDAPVTFRVVFPCTQVIVIRFTEGLGALAAELDTFGSSGLAAIFTGKISLYAGAAWSVIQFFTRM